MRPADAPPPLDALLAERAWVHALSRRLVRHDDQADDAEQAVWTAAVERPPASDRSVRGWLAVALRNAARKLGRSESRRSRHEAVAGLRHAARPERAVRTPDEIVAETELQRKVARAVAELPPPMRDVLLLRYYEDLAPAAVAARLGVPVETVRTRHRRAIERLRERLDSEHRGGRAEWTAIALAWDDGGPRSAARRAAPVAAAGALAFLPKLAAALAAGMVVVLVAIALLAPGNGDETDAADTGAPPRGTSAGQPDAAAHTAPRPAAARNAGTRLDVTVRRDGRPVAAHVTLRDEPAARPARLRADFDADTDDFLRDALGAPVAAGDAGSDGLARFDGLAPGRRLVEAVDATGHTAAVQVVVAGDTLAVTLDLPAATPDLHGRIVAPAGPSPRRFAVVPDDWRPGPDAAPDWRPAEANGAFAWSGRLRGRARLPDLDPGRALRLMVRAPGRLDVLDAQIDGWTPADTTVALRRAGVVTCRVTDDAGRPVAGATVRVGVPSTGGSATSRTDADGRAAIGGLPESGDVEVVSADSQGTARATGEVRRVAVGSRDVPLALKGPLLRVRIEGPRESLGHDGLRVQSADGRAKAVAAIDGEHVVVAGIAAGSTVSLRTGGSDREDATAWADDVGIGPDGAQVTLRVERGLPVAGRLDGTPDAMETAAFADVVATCGGFRWSGDVRDGRFRFPSLPPGEYRLELSEDDWVAEATVRAGAEDVVLTLRRRE